MVRNRRDADDRDVVDVVYVRMTAMEMSEDRTRAAFACCVPPAVPLPRRPRGWPNPNVEAIRADAVTAFNASTGSLIKLRASSGRPLTVTRLGRVWAPLPARGEEAAADRLVVADRVPPSSTGRCSWWRAPGFESPLASDDDEDDRGDDRTSDAAGRALTDALLAHSGDEARLAALADAAARGRTAGLEPCEYVCHFEGEEAAVEAMLLLARYAGGEQIARGLRAMDSDRARMAALRAMPPAVSRRVDGASLLRSFATDDARLGALRFTPDRHSEVLAPALLSCFDEDARRADALRLLPASAVTDYNLRAVVTHFGDDRPSGGLRLGAFRWLARERPGACANWMAACAACFPPDSTHRRAAAKVARRAAATTKQTTRQLV